MFFFFSRLISFFIIHQFCTKMEVQAEASDTDPYHVEMNLRHWMWSVISRLFVKARPEDDCPSPEHLLQARQNSQDKSVADDSEMDYFTANDGRKSSASSEQYSSASGDENSSDISAARQVSFFLLIFAAVQWHDTHLYTSLMIWFKNTILIFMNRFS